jgi:hypothetical protein
MVREWFGTAYCVKILTQLHHTARCYCSGVREELADGTLVSEVRHLIVTGAAERLRWIRSNTRAAMAASGQDAVTISAFSGVAVGTVRGFLANTDTSIKNVLMIAVALGLTVADLERPPQEFGELLASRYASSPAGEPTLHD